VVKEDFFNNPNALKQFVFILPATGLDGFIEVRHRALPDVTIFKAYGLFHPIIT
jgi:hypothetical protein